MPDLSLRKLYPPFEAYTLENGYDVTAAYAALNLLAASAAVGNLVEDKVLRPEGLTLAGWRLLLTLRLGGPNEPRNLSRILFLTRPSVVNALNTLEKLGLIEREPSLTDRRLVTAHLTPSGAALFDKVARPWFEMLESVSAALSDEATKTLADLAGHVAVAAERLLDSGSGAHFDDLESEPG